MWFSCSFFYALYQTFVAVLHVQHLFSRKQYVTKAAYRDVVAWVLLWCVYSCYVFVWDALLWIVYARNNMLFSMLEAVALLVGCVHRGRLIGLLLAHETDIQALPLLWYRHTWQLVALLHSQADKMRVNRREVDACDEN
jgi:hypothetical protein